MVGGERWSDVVGRAHRVRDTLGDDDTLLISHQYFIVAIAGVLLGTGERIDALGYGGVLELTRRTPGPWTVQDRASR